jgi:hypothetical protein
MPPRAPVRVTLSARSRPAAVATAPPRLARDHRCECCGYQIAVPRPHPRCPMCGEHAWALIGARGQPRLADRRALAGL